MGGHRGYVDASPLDVMFKGDRTAIAAYLHGRSICEVSEQLNRSQERVRAYFKKYGVSPVVKCPRCGSTQDLTSNSICRPCRHLEVNRPDAMDVMFRLSRQRMESQSPGALRCYLWQAAYAEGAG